MRAAASRQVRASISRARSSACVVPARPAKHDGRQQAVVELRKAALQHHGRVAVGDADEGPAADQLHQDRRQHAADQRRA